VILASVQTRGQGRHLGTETIQRELKAMAADGLLIEVRQGRALLYQPADVAALVELVGDADGPMIDLRPAADRRMLTDRVRRWQDSIGGGTHVTNDMTINQRQHARRLRLTPPSFPGHLPTVLYMERISRTVEAHGPIHKSAAMVGCGGNNVREPEGWERLLTYGYVVQVGDSKLYESVRPYRCLRAYVPGHGELPWWECIEPSDRYKRTIRTRADVLVRTE
jgi:hypothetical protein